MAQASGPAIDYDAIVVAGGRSTRMGADKTRLDVGGVSVLDRVLAAVADAGRRVVVGEPRPLAVDAVWAREDPASGGPAAGVVAGLGAVTAPIVVLLAGDLPRVGGATVHRLLRAIGAGGESEAGAGGPTGGSGAGRPADGAVLVDADGRRQHLTCAVVTEALRRSAAARPTWHDAAMSALLAPLRLRPVPAAGGETDDIDTPADLSALRVADATPVTDGSREGGVMTLQEWVAAVQAELDTDLDLDLDQVLNLARDAAHEIARPAAPLTTFLVGYAAGRRAGSPDDVTAASDAVRRLIDANASATG